MGVNLFVDLETLQLIQGPGQRGAVNSLRFKRGDLVRVEVVFLANGTTPTIIGNPNGLEIQFGIKPRNQFERAYLVHSTNWSMPSVGEENPSYSCAINFNTEELNSTLNIGSVSSEELPEVTLMGEITWHTPQGDQTSTRTFLVIVENDVNRGNEGVPTSANPSYPAPDQIITSQSLGARAVRHDVAQQLSSAQKEQARVNIGALGEIADQSLTIAKTAGLQSALNSKAATTHQHSIAEVELLIDELAARVEFLVGVGPEDLDASNNHKTLIHEKNGDVWFSNPALGSIILSNSETPPASIPGQIVTTVHLTGGEWAQFPPASLSIVPPGQYQVNVSATNFNTSNWGSHSLMLKYDVGNGYFYDLSPGDLYDMYEDQAAMWLAFFLNDATSQSGAAKLQLFDASDFYIEGWLPNEGDSVTITITFTPI